MTVSRSTPLGVPADRSPLGDTTVHRTRVALFGFRAGSGGIGRVMLNIANGLQEDGAQVDLLLPAGPNPDAAEVLPGIARFAVDGNGGTALRRLAGYLSDRQPVSILCNKPFALRLALDARRLAGVDTRVIARVAVHNTQKLKRRNWLSRARGWRRIRRDYPRADRIIVNATDIAADVTKVPGVDPGAVHVIFNPADRADMVRRVRMFPEHPWLRLKDRPVIVTVGRLVARKNQAMLLRAFARVRAERACRCLLLGDGPDRDRLRRLARKLGVAADVDMPGYFANPFCTMVRADVFALTSRAEGSPNALIEALCLGIPSVATDCLTGPREILDHGRYGALVPVDDDERLAAAIVDLLAHPTSPAVLRQGALRFDKRRNVRTYARILGVAPAGTAHGG